MDTPQSSSARKLPLAAISVIAIIVAVIGLVVMVMPKGFKTTHEDIGKGKPAVVFVYDAGLAVSNSQTEQMNEARAHLGDNVLFLLARAGTPDGDKLIANYRASSAELLLFDPSGKLIKRKFAVSDANELMRWVR
ncbi:hypothetical protein [Shewanella aestuarii]|uniref:Uncharacterized protein n=1 Tax=Shewanella aestuarii TaxID=1028752 RepID=A0A6G9QHN7_9GAMM|nr:hypothetical protein [Shewanella aestuarii]QIR13411.1 hypothetical protein HBH39_01970 [Shewanella aestuarii]